MSNNDNINHKDNSSNNKKKSDINSNSMNKF